MKNLCLLCLILFSLGCRRETADIIIFNAKVYTVDSSFSKAQAFAVKNGRFVAVGSNEFVMKKYRALRSIDLKGKPVYPGFIDAHSHFLGYGLNQTKVNLLGTKSFEEVLQRLIEYRAAHPDESWITGRGWDQNDWEIKEFPNRRVLDSIFPNTPVIIRRACGAGKQGCPRSGRHQQQNADARR